MKFTIAGYRSEKDIPKWELEVAAVIAENYESKALEYDAKLRESLSSIISAADPGHVGIETLELINADGRIDYHDDVEINGHRIDYSVDKLTHVITIYEV